MAPEWLNVGCGTHNAPAPWWNIDVVSDPSVAVVPDEVVPRGPLPYPDVSVQRVMLSHVLEHQPWHRVVPFLRDVLRVLVAGGEVCVIGPDVHRTIERWKAGAEPWHMVESVMEHANGRGDIDGPWPEARHHWNCTEDRVVLGLEVAGFASISRVPVPSPDLGRWPTFGPAPWQCAALAVAP